MTKTVRKLFFFAANLLLSVAGSAQSFAWKAGLEAVPQSGFYRMPLSPDWLWRLKTDLSDVRIHNEKGEAVPFLLQQQLNTQGKTFLDFQILRNTSDTAVSTLELDAGNRPGTGRIDLVMNNTAVERFASISGSDDRKQWFIIDERLKLTNAPGNRGGYFVQSLYFPFIRYRYLKLQVRNEGTDPLPVIKAGVYVDTTLRSLPEEYPNPGTTFRQSDSADSYSYVWIHNQLSYPVDKISLQLTGVRFYQREVQIFKVEAGKRMELLTSTELRSDRKPEVWLPSVKSPDLLVRIKNGDNPALKIASVTTFTRQQQLIAYLEKGKEYTLLGGNADASSPQYDITHFRDSIPAILPALTYQSIVENNKTQLAGVEGKQWWVWPAVISMLVCLTIVTLRMVREIKQNNV
jgi:hypothetical protein